MGALANLTSGVAAKLAVASIVVIVGGATELGRVVAPTPPPGDRGDRAEHR
jgi:hypothetical protein